MPIDRFPPPCPVPSGRPVPVSHTARHTASCETCGEPENVFAPQGWTTLTRWCPRCREVRNFRLRGAPREDTP